MFMQESEKVVSVSSDHLEPVTPTKNNKVRTTVAVSGVQLSADCSFRARVRLNAAFAVPRFR